MKLLSTDQLRARVPVSRVKLNQMVDRGEFPAPVQVAGQLMFVESEVSDWIDRQPRGLFQQPEGLKRKQAERRRLK